LPRAFSTRQVTTAKSGRTAAETDSRSGRSAWNDGIITEFMTDGKWSSYHHESVAAQPHLNPNRSDAPASPARTVFTTN